MHGLGILVASALSSLVLACGEPCKTELMDKAEGANTREQLRTGLGEPDDLAKVGPLEKWTYKASDGEVTYIITGDSVALELADSQSTQ